MVIKTGISRIFVFDVFKLFLCVFNYSFKYSFKKIRVATIPTNRKTVLLLILVGSFLIKIHLLILIITIRILEKDRWHLDRVSSYRNPAISLASHIVMVWADVKMSGNTTGSHPATSEPNYTEF